MNDNEEKNGNVDTTIGVCIGKTGSVDDISEYTDADESISAPTEILAEFLSSIMIKDYPAAFKYCKVILQYEPNHTTAKEFFPLLLQKCNQNNHNNNNSNNNNNEEDDGNATLGDSSDEPDYMSDDTNDFDDENDDSDDENSGSNDECDEESSITSSPEGTKQNSDGNLAEKDLSSNGTRSELEIGGTTSYSSFDEDAEIQYDQLNEGSSSNSSKENSHASVSKK